MKSLLHVFVASLIPPLSAGVGNVAGEPKPLRRFLRSRPSSKQTTRSLQSKSLLQLIKNRKAYSTLESILDSAELEEAFDGSRAEKVTVFAPRNRAFNTLSVDYNYTEEGWGLHLQNIIFFHMLDGENEISSLSNGEQIEMLNEEELTVDIDEETVQLTNLDGTSVATVTQSDVKATNGVLHGVNKILLPSFVFTNAWEKVSGTPILGTFGELLFEAGLANDMGNYPHTILAPVDAAFADLPDGALESLRSNPDKLRHVLLYHALEGPQPSTFFSASRVVIQASQGDTINVTRSGNSVMFNDATVAKADVLASNGIIHIITRLLVPPGFDILDDNSFDDDGNWTDDNHTGWDDDFWANYTDDNYTGWDDDFWANYTDDFWANYTDDFWANYTDDFWANYTDDTWCDDNFTGWDDDFWANYTDDFYGNYTDDFWANYTDDFSDDWWRDGNYTDDIAWSDDNSTGWDDDFWANYTDDFWDDEFSGVDDFAFGRDGESEEGEDTGDFTAFDNAP